MSNPKFKQIAADIRAAQLKYPELEQTQDRWIARDHDGEKQFNTEYNEYIAPIAEVCALGLCIVYHRGKYVVNNIGSNWIRDHYGLSAKQVEAITDLNDELNMTFDEIIEALEGWEEWDDTTN